MVEEGTDEAGGGSERVPPCPPNGWLGFAGGLQFHSGSIGPKLHPFKVKDKPCPERAVGSAVLFNAAGIDPRTQNRQGKRAHCNLPSPFTMSMSVSLAVSRMTGTRNGEEGLYFLKKSDQLPSGEIIQQHQ